MSDHAPGAGRLPLLLVGATGRVGSAVIAATADRPGLRLAALARRETALPAGARLERLIADPADWGAAIARARPAVVVIALGTTRATQSGDRRAFRRVDHDLVLDVARAARAAGTRQMIVVSSAGADRASRHACLSVKGDMEAALTALNFARLDILRPGWLRGAQYGDLRATRRIGQIVARLLDPLLRGRLAMWRSVHARDLAAAILALAGRPGRGRHVHRSPDIRGLARQSRAPA